MNLFVGGAVFTVVVLVLQVVFGVTIPVLPPTALVSIALGFLLVASYLAYHDLRMQRLAEQKDLQTPVGLAGQIGAFLATIPTQGQWDHQLIYYQNSTKELLTAAYLLAERGLLDKARLEATLARDVPSSHESDRYIARLRDLKAMLDE